MDVTDFERGIPREGCEIGTLCSILSNRGSVAHFLMPLVDCSSAKTSGDTRDERLPVGELSYPLLEMETCRNWVWPSNSPWLNSLDRGRRGEVLGEDKPLERGESFFFMGGVCTGAGTEIDRLVFVTGSALVLLSPFSPSDMPLSSTEFRFGFFRTVL